MKEADASAEAVASSPESEPGLFDVWDDAKLESIITALSVPRPIREVEAVEAWIKKSWLDLGPDTFNTRTHARFTEFFLQLGVLPKYKSYGVKYATPFGYSLFDLQNNSGFSIQLHEAAKIEAFHVLGVHPQAFILLCAVNEWEKHGRDMIDLWVSGHPENSPLAYRPQVGDVAVIQDLSTVHTVVGCLVEEFATSSYDVVSRLHDQNAGTAVTLPSAHISLFDVLKTAIAIEPRRRVCRNGEWRGAEIAPGSTHITNLPDMGLVATHVVLSHSAPIAEAVGQSSVLTVVVLTGRIELDVEGAKFAMRAGDITALAPGANYTITSVTREARLSLCDAASNFAFADLR
jgi:mannose-6-phosphate isomerase-like protein (cupin superfamily)